MMVSTDTLTYTFDERIETTSRTSIHHGGTIRSSALPFLSGRRCALMLSCARHVFETVIVTLCLTRSYLPRLGFQVVPWRSFPCFLELPARYLRALGGNLEHKLEVAGDQGWILIKLRDNHQCPAAVESISLYPFMNLRQQSRQVHT